MRLVNLTTARIKSIIILTLTTFTFLVSFSQENSPYSRYGVGDIVPSQNILNRAMGGISAGYADYYTLNFSNPASLGFIRWTILEVGAEVDRRTLKSNISPEKYTSTNATISYLQFGIPISTKKMKSKGTIWGASFGIRPISKINYKIENRSRLAGVDSLSTLYEGTGGLNQASLSTGINIKNLAIGVTFGYVFGSKDYSTRLNFINDSVIYYRSNTQAKTSFTGGSLTAGMIYTKILKDTSKKKQGVLRFGAYGTFSQNLNARQSFIDESSGNSTDTVQFIGEKQGKIIYPASFSIGFTRVMSSKITMQNWIYGADFQFTNWDSYRFYGEKDLVKSNWRIKAGAQYASLKTSKYAQLIQYRAGAYFGPDLVKLDNKPRNEFGLTFGAGFPLSKTSLAMLNTGVELGTRGSKESKSLRENLMRFTVGLTMNASWFLPRKYD